MSPARPVDLSEFEPVRELGRGGLGIVWAVRHRPTGTLVAVKFLRRSMGGLRSRYAFEREVRAQGSLHHPRVLPVLAFGEMDEDRFAGVEVAERGRLWCAMEYVPGGSLLDHAGSLDGPVVRSVALAVLDALAHCHARKLVHLDIKPGNLLVRDAPESVVLADFGITRGFGASERIAGTPAYMAPEQITGGAVDGRTDLYSLGCMVYHLLTGIPPFLGSFEQLRRAHVEAPFPQVGDPDVDRWLEGLTAKAPAHRYPSAAAAAAALPVLGSRRTPSGAAAATTVFHSLDVGEMSPAPAGPPPPHGSRPIPADWRSPPFPAHHPFVLGLGSLGLRSVPMMGRESARDHLWSALIASRAGRASLVVVTGVPGSGRSRLLDWFGERLRELDCAEVYDGLVGGRPVGPSRVCLLDDAHDLGAVRRHVDAEARLRARLLVVAVAPMVAAGDIVLGPLGSAHAVSLCHALLSLDPDEAVGVCRRAGFLPGAIVAELSARSMGGDVDGPGEPVGTRSVDDPRAAAVLKVLEWTEPMAAEHLLAVTPHEDVLAALIAEGIVQEAGDLVRGRRCPPAHLDATEARALLSALEQVPLTARQRMVLCAVRGDDVGLQALLDASYERGDVPPAHHLQRLLTLVRPDCPLRAEIEVAWVHAMVLGGDHGRAIAVGTGLAQRIGDPHLRGVLLTRLAEARIRRGELERGEADALRARALRADAPPPVRIRADVACVMAEVASGRAQDAVARMEACRPWAERSGARRLWLAWTRLSLASAGRLDEAVEVSRILVEEFPDKGEHRLAHAMIQLDRGFPADARLHAEAVLRRGRRRVATASTLLSLICLVSDDLEAAERHAYAPDPGYTAPLRIAVQVALLAADVAAPFDAVLDAWRGAFVSADEVPWHRQALEKGAERAGAARLDERASRIRDVLDGLSARSAGPDRSP